MIGLAQVARRRGEAHEIVGGRPPACAAASSKSRCSGRAEVSNRFGVRITLPARTIAHVAEIGTDPSVVIEATDRALATGLVTARELNAAVRGRSARVRQLIGRAVDEAGAGV